MKCYLQLSMFTKVTKISKILLIPFKEFCKDKIQAKTLIVLNKLGLFINNKEAIILIVIIIILILAIIKTKI